MNYFTLFNLPKQFNIDKKLLSKNFYKLQLQFHPDLFINSTDSKKKIILEKSIKINKGYKTLKNFLSRAIYLLSLNNVQIKKENVLLENNFFLTKYFSLYEELDNLQENNFNQIKFDIFLEKIEKNIKKYEEKIEIEFKKKNFEKIIKIISELLFLKKIKINFKKEQKAYLKQID